MTMLGKKHSEESKKKMSEARKSKKLTGNKNPFFGKKHSQETKQKMREKKLQNPTKYWLNKKRPEMLFEKNKNWSGGISRYRELAFEKYNLEPICDICRSIIDLVVHHIDENRRNNAKENLQIMCKPCHTSHHSLGRKYTIIGGVKKAL